MTILGDFHFLRPVWLLLVPVAVLVWWRVSRTREPLRGWRAVIDSDLLLALTDGNPPRALWRDAALLAGWLLAIFAVAGPTWRPEPSPFADDPVPVMVLLKADETMDLSDLMPNRMERARLKVVDFANQRQGQPLGLAAYAGSAHLVLPPTRDSDVVSSMAVEVSTDIMPQPGDDLAAALRLADQTLAETGGSIVVVTDTVEPANRVALADFRKQSKVPVFFLAIARNQTPEIEAIREAASALRADVVLMTATSDDVQFLARHTAHLPVGMREAAEGLRWEEAGWWLVPVVAVLSLASFRRVRGSQEDLT